MKALKLHSFGMMVIAVLILLVSGCDQKDEAAPSDEDVREGEGLSEGDVAHDEGAIALSISSRSIARKGYQPSIADVTVDATTGDFSRSVPIDSLTNIAHLTYDNENLTPEQRQELSDGVNVYVRILDVNGDLLAEQDLSKISFQPSPPDKDIRADGLEDQYAGVHLREDLKYYMQITEKGENEIYGAPSSEGYEYSGGVTSHVNVLKSEHIDYNSDFPEHYTTFYFQKVHTTPEPVYSIYVEAGDKLFYLYIKLETGRLGIQNRMNHDLNGGNTDPTLLSNYH